MSPGLKTSLTSLQDAFTLANSHDLCKAGILALSPSIHGSGAHGAHKNADSAQKCVFENSIPLSIYTATIKSFRYNTAQLLWKDHSQVFHNIET